jgi:hypothetical protein
VFRSRRCELRRKNAVWLVDNVDRCNFVDGRLKKSTVGITVVPLTLGQLTLVWPGTRGADWLEHYGASQAPHMFLASPTLVG